MLHGICGYKSNLIIETHQINPYFFAQLLHLLVAIERSNVCVANHQMDWTAGLFG